ncbi:MAG TPA: outer membrane beta-barrel protein [Sphingomicrobium sp.]|nr:outer membrane beta-barrel protein [Sphingomicrobium sp.]
MRARITAGVALAALVVAAPAFAKQAGSPPAPAQPSRTTVYQAAFFVQYAPRTAYDIVQHVPGFQLDLGATQTQQGSVDVRGFAGTAGNVVINGSRPSTKAETIDVTLQKIPAQQVIRVELGPGDLYGSDYAGKSQVLNVVLSQQAGIDGEVTAAAKRWFTGYVNTDIQGSVSVRRGPSTFNFSGGTGRNRQLEEGDDDLTDFATGALIEHRRKHNSYYNKDPFISGTWSLERAADKAFHLNARWQPSSFDLFQSNRVSTVGFPVHDDNLIQTYRDPVIEIGGDVSRPLADGAIKFVALATRRKRHDVDDYIQHDGLLPDAVVNGGFLQSVRARRNETLGRLSWTRSNFLGLSFEAGAEASYNTLDDNVDLFSVDENGDQHRIDLPIANAMVKEKRGEVYVNLGKTLSPSLRIDGGINYEFSNLQVTGDANASRTLKFLKPNITLDWKPGGGWHSQLSIRRTVAQLNFYDFISVGDLSAHRVTGSNADLQPQRDWEFHGTVEHPLLGDGLFKFAFGYDVVSKLQDLILIVDDQGKTFSGPGNLGTGKRYFGSLTVDAPLGQFWNGLRAKFTSTLQHTEVDDPITHQPRKWSGFWPSWQWDLNVRRDLGRFSYGFEVSDNQRFTFYRTDEFDTNFNRSAYMTAFIEYRPTPRTAINFFIDNLLDTHAARDRILFSPDRAHPTSVLEEFRDRDRHPAFQITLKQSFGGTTGTKVASKDK